MPAKNQWDISFEDEKEMVEKSVAEIVKLLNHHTFSTRKELISFLEQSAESVGLELDADTLRRMALDEK